MGSLASFQCSCLFVCHRSLEAHYRINNDEKEEDKFCKACVVCTTLAHHRVLLQQAFSPPLPFFLAINKSFVGHNLSARLGICGNLLTCSVFMLQYSRL